MSFPLIFNSIDYEFLGEENWILYLFIYWLRDEKSPIYLNLTRLNTLRGHVFIWQIFDMFLFFLVENPDFRLSFRFNIVFILSIELM